MEWERRGKLIWRWGFTVATAAALFWFTWSQVADVPAATGFQIAEKWSYPFPFSVSRWWDVLAAPLWSTIVILFFTTDSWLMPGSDLIFGLIFGMVIVLGWGLIFGLIIGLDWLINQAISKWPKVKTEIGNWLLAKQPAGGAF